METKNEITSKLFDLKTNGQVIYWTTDYNIFTLVSGNRSEQKNNVKKLKRSILEVGWIKSSYLLIGDKMRVYDGQNRLWALKEIREETGKIYQIGYIIDKSLSLEITQHLNNYRVSWKPIDYVESNVKLGNKDYSIIKSIMEEYKLTYTTILSLATGYCASERTTSLFRSGKFEIQNRDELIQRVIWIESIKPFFKSYNTKNFVLAMTFFFKNVNFNMDEFIAKLTINRDMLYPSTTVESYKKLIQDIYNYRRRDKITFIMV